MKTINNTLYFSILAIILVLGLYSCATKSPFLRSTIVPAAEGQVGVKQDKNSNYKIDINVRNLASPERLDPARKAYVVWMETDDRSAKNLGQMKTSTGMINKALRASLETVTPLKPHKIFITAEDDADVQYPGAQVILSTGKL
jgi:hypothetical protein